MNISDRRKLLFAVVDQAQEAREAWVDSDLEHFPRTLEQAFDELVEAFAYGDLPADCRALDQRVGDFARQWEAWKLQAEISSDPNFLPNRALWKAFDAIVEGRQQATPRKKVQLESIKDLTEQKVSDWQICKIYGWTDGNGDPDLNKLREEREAPGTHTGPGFIPPLEREQAEQLRQQAELAKRIQLRQEQKLERLKPAPPEELADLVKQGVSAEQIGTILGLSLDEVYAQCKAQGLASPVARYESPQATQGIHQKDLPESTQRAFDAVQRNPIRQRSEQQLSQADMPEPQQPIGPMTLEQEIVYYRQTTDWNAQEIADAVSSEEAQVSRQKVAAIIKRYQEDPAAFEPLPAG